MGGGGRQGLIRASGGGLGQGLNGSGGAETHGDKGRWGRAA